MYDVLEAGDSGSDHILWRAYKVKERGVSPLTLERASRHTSIHY